MSKPEPGLDESLKASEEVRRQLIGFCRSRDSKTVTRSRELPSRWEPGVVRHPETGEPFDTMSAWAFIADVLESGVDIEIKPLKKPPDKKGYVVLVDGFKDERIYIKLQFGARGVLGRSFHVSNEGRDE